MNEWNERTEDGMTEWTESDHRVVAFSHEFTLFDLSPPENTGFIRVVKVQLFIINPQSGE